MARAKKSTQVANPKKADPAKNAEAKSSAVPAPVIEPAQAPASSPDTAEAGSSQNIDNYELPPAVPMAEQAGAVATPAAEQTECEQTEAQPATLDLDAALEAGLTHSTSSGTVAHEMDFAIHRFKLDRAAHKNETKYRLECLRGDASEEEKAKIDAILAAL